MKRNKGFTLAEVLITLVVIGIIAAITVPIVMANHRKQETSARLKKFYSSLSQAVRLAQTDNFSFIKDSRSFNNRDSIDIWWNKYLNSLPIAKHENTTYKITSATDEAGVTPDYIYSLNDGSLIIFSEYCSSESSCSFLYDVNGEKGPNYRGRDVFYFHIQQYDKDDEGIHWVKVCSGETCRYNYYGNRNSYINYCKEYTDTADCTKLLEIDGWEFKDDYPIRL